MQFCVDARVYERTHTQASKQAHIMGQRKYFMNKRRHIRIHTHTHTHTHNLR